MWSIMKNLHYFLRVNNEPETANDENKVAKVIGNFKLFLVPFNLQVRKKTVILLYTYTVMIQCLPTLTDCYFTNYSAVAFSSCSEECIYSYLRSESDSHNHGLSLYSSLSLASSYTAQ
jgi:hypothetical protein